MEIKESTNISVSNCINQLKDLKVEYITRSRQESTNACFAQISTQLFCFISIISQNKVNPSISCSKQSATATPRIER